MKNPSEKAYIFFSYPQNSQSRIDMIWTTSDLLIETREVNIHPRTLADHNLLEWVINTRRGRKIWKLNNVYWQDPKFKNQVEKEMKEFFEINLNGEVNCRTVWNAGKAYLRGTVIKYAAAKNKERNKVYKEIINKLQKLEKELYKHPDDNKLKKEIIHIQHQYNLLNTQEMARKIKLNKHFFPKMQIRRRNGWHLDYGIRKKREGLRVSKRKRVIYIQMI